MEISTAITHKVELEETQAEELTLEIQYSP